MNKRSDTIRSAGQMVLQDPQENYRYQGYINNASQIQAKATGKLGSKFFDETTTENDRIDQILRLKKKMKHKQLEDQGYFIHEKPNQEYEGRELELDIPIYEIFDLPNPNYRQIFRPQEDLRPIVGYVFNNEEETEELFYDEEEHKLIEVGNAKEDKKINRRNFLLSRLNKNIGQFQEEVKKQQSQQDKDEIVKRVVIEKLDREDNLKVSLKSQRLLRQQQYLKKYQNLNVEWIQRETKAPTMQRVGRSGKQIEVRPKSILQTKNHSLEKKSVHFDESSPKGKRQRYQQDRPSLSPSEENKWKQNEHPLPRRQQLN